MIKDISPTKEYLSLKNLETYEKMAGSRTTKIVVPDEMQNTASFLTSARKILISDVVKDTLGRVIRPRRGWVKCAEHLSIDVSHGKQGKIPAFFRSF